MNHKELLIYKALLDKMLPVSWQTCRQESGARSGAKRTCSPSIALYYISLLSGLGNILLTPSGRTNPIGQPCSAFVPLLETFLPDPDLCYLVLPENLILPDPDLCRGRKIGPTGTSGQPFGPGVVLFWAAAGAILSFLESLADPSCCVH